MAKQYILKDKRGNYCRVICNELSADTDMLKCATVYSKSEITEIKKTHFNTIIEYGIMAYEIKRALGRKVGLDKF